MSGKKGAVDRAKSKRNNKAKAWSRRQKIKSGDHIVKHRKK